MVKEKIGWLFVLGLMMPVTVAAQPVMFEGVRIPLPPAVRFGTVAVGDVDQDRDMDILVTGSESGYENPAPFTQVYRNDGNTSIVVENLIGDLVEVEVIDFRDLLNIGTTPLRQVWQSAAIWEDYDMDGDLDLTIAGIEDTGVPSLRLYEWFLSSDQLSSDHLLAGVYAGDVDWGDMDNDGDPDLAVCGRGLDDAPVLTIYENLLGEGGGFRDVQGEFTGVFDCTLEWGDYDTDGDKDLLVTGITDPQSFVTHVYRNDNGSLALQDYAIAGLLFASASWGDFDADGDLDILLSGARITPRPVLEGEVRIYRNNQGAFHEVDGLLSGSFENDATLGRYYGDANWGDYTNSGYLDFVIAGAKTPNSTESVQLYDSDRGERFFKSGSERFDGGVFGGALWVDYDMDMDLDLLVWGEIPGTNLSTIVMQRNTLEFPTRKPRPPSLLEETVAGNTVMLSWSGASDRQSPTSTLTYNLRVGTRQGSGVDIMSPMADVSTGERYVMRRGNVDHNTQWTLRNLPPGRYYWSVQALDHTLTASEFATEGSFLIESN